tara:strand:- start:838 stop:1524 length:687 start_codon:yes stop_codon:yes gene_type:complete
MEQKNMEHGIESPKSGSFRKGREGRRVQFNLRGNEETIYDPRKDREKFKNLYKKGPRKRGHPKEEGEVNADELTRMRRSGEKIYRKPTRPAREVSASVLAYQRAENPNQIAENKRIRWEGMNKNAILGGAIVAAVAVSVALIISPVVGLPILGGVSALLLLSCFASCFASNDKDARAVNAHGSNDQDEADLESPLITGVNGADVNGGGTAILFDHQTGDSDNSSDYGM